MSKFTITPVKLSEAVLPEGTPRLMQLQQFPFNGDGYLAAEILRLRDKHELITAVETGTCLGVTTRWLWEHFDTVFSVESNAKFYALASQCLHDTDVNLAVGDSIDFIRTVRGLHRTLFFLDAHDISGKPTECPLLREIEAISDKGIRPVIVIHDFYVPGRPDLGYDCFPDGRPFKLENVNASLDRVYGVDGWDFHYNDRAEGAKRGVLFVEPR